MTRRRYEVYGPCANCEGHIVLGVHHDLVDPYGERLPPTEELCQVCGETGHTRLDSIPDDLVEEAAKRIALYVGVSNLDVHYWKALARAALSVLFEEIANWCAGCGAEGHSDDDPHDVAPEPNNPFHRSVT